jgi:hypothetical protein
MTMTEPTLRVVDESHANGCVHHWVLTDPSNGVIPGVCKRCGAERGFPTNPEGVERFDDYRELTQSSSYYGDRKSA